MLACNATKQGRLSPTHQILTDPAGNIHFDFLESICLLMFFSGFFMNFNNSRPYSYLQPVLHVYYVRLHVYGC